MRRKKKMVPNYYLKNAARAAEKKFFKRRELEEGAAVTEKEPEKNMPDAMGIVRHDAACIMTYYAEIPGIAKSLKEERELLELDYDPARGISYEGIRVQTNGTSDSTQSIAMRLIDKGSGDRIAEIDRTLDILKADERTIKRCLDSLRSAYKHILMVRYVSGGSWGDVARKVAIPESTARSWHKKALAKLAMAVQMLPDAEGLVSRARLV